MSERETAGERPAQASREPEPLSAERLAEIREKLEPGYLRWVDEAGIMPAFVREARELLADNDRLRAELASYRQYVEEMAAFSPIARVEEIQRVVIEARALLADSGGPA